jgi:hypothetical protein
MLCAVALRVVGGLITGTGAAMTLCEPSSTSAKAARSAHRDRWRIFIGFAHS